MSADELEIMSEDEFYQNDKKEDSDLENNGLSNKKDDSDYENNDSGLENKEDKPKRKKSKKDEDANVDGESDNPGETPEEREELKKKKAGIKDFFKGKHGRNFLLALDVLLAIAFFAQPDLYYNPQAPDFFDRFYADSLIICGGLWAVLVFLTVKKIHFSAEVNRILTYIAGIATPFIAFL